MKRSRRILMILVVLLLDTEHAASQELPSPVAPLTACEQDLRSTSEYAGLVRTKRDAQIVEEEMEIARLRARVWYLEKEILRLRVPTPAPVLIP